MAGEIVISLSVVGSKGGATASVTASNVVDMTLAGVDISSQTHSVTSTSAIIPVGAVALGGIMVIKNMSTAVSVYITKGTAVVTSPILVKYGETVTFRTTAGTPYEAVTASGTALIQIVCFED